MVLGKASPLSILRPPSGPMLFTAPATLFVECPTNNNCGSACPGGFTAPLSARLTIAIYSYPCSSASVTPLASGTITTTNGTMVMPASSPTGAFTSYNVQVSIPGGTPAGIYCVNRNRDSDFL